MPTQVDPPNPPGRQGSGLAFMFVLGLVLGVLTTTLVADRGQPNIVIEGGIAAPSQAGGTGTGPGTEPSAPGTGEPGATTTEPGDPAGGTSAPAGGTAGPAGTTGTGTASSDGPAAPGSEPAGGGDTGGAADEPGTADRTGADAPSGPAPDRASARGVYDDRITIGIAVPDLGALRHLGPEYDNGTPEEQWQAMYERWEREGLIPIHGRDVELVFRRYDVVDEPSQSAVCRQLVQDDKAFAVIGIAYFRSGSECVAREQNTPLLTSDGPSDQQLKRAHPNLFSLGMSDNRVVRNMLHFAHHAGILQDKKIGVYYENIPEDSHLAEVDIPQTLQALGHPGVAVSHSTDQPLGGPQDSIAVQRFRSEGVEIAILLTAKPGFMQQAEAQGYRPTYLESDHDFGTSDTAAANYPPEHFDGTYAITGRRVGEVSAGETLDAGQEACLANFERHTGRRPEAETAEWSYILMDCDLGDLLLYTLERAGEYPTHDSFRAAFETIQEPRRMLRYLPTTFRPDKHHGTDMYRVVQWHADCECWQAQGEWQPLFAP